MKPSERINEFYEKIIDKKIRCSVYTNLPDGIEAIKMLLDEEHVKKQEIIVNQDNCREVIETIKLKLIAKEIKREAIKEFAERLFNKHWGIEFDENYHIPRYYIKQLLKEYQIEL